MKTILIQVLIIYSFLFLFFPSFSFAQSVDVGVDKFSGAPFLTVPLGEITEEGLNLPLNLVYSTSGVKVSEQGGEVGIGWSLSFSSSIQRTVNDLPDDINETADHGSRKGWLYHNSILPGTPTGSDCSDELSSWNQVNTLYEGKKDLQGDQFNMKFPNGRTIKFVYNKVLNRFEVFPYENLKIKYATNVSGAISSFTVSTSDGTVFEFADVEQETRQAQGGNSSKKFHGRTFANYQTELTFASAWHLSKITAANGETIIYSYSLAEQTYPTNVSAAPFKYFVKNQDTFEEMHEFDLITTFKRVPQLSLIASKNYRVYLYRNAGYYSTISDDKNRKHLQEISIRTNGTLLAKYKLNINIVHGGRAFLSSILQPTDCEYYQVNSFQYYGIGFKSILPATDSKSQDYWGYFNDRVNSKDFFSFYYYRNENGFDRFRLYPKADRAMEYHFPGNNGTVNPSAVMAGMLNRVQNAQGGYTEVDYEPNSYYDEKAGKNQYGGGVRVAKIRNYDRVNAEPIVTDYQYTTSKNANASSGRLENKPVFGFPSLYHFNSLSNLLSFRMLQERVNNGSITYQGLLDHLIFRTPFSLSGDWVDGGDVSYTNVYEIKKGNGYTLTKFKNDFDLGSLVLGQETPTEVTLVRPENPEGGCLDTGILEEGFYAFPFVSNPRAMFSEGSVESVQFFTENNTLIKEQINQYEDLRSEFVVNNPSLAVHPVPAYATGEMYDPSTLYPEKYDYKLGTPVYVYGKPVTRTGTTARIISQIAREYDFTGNVLSSTEKTFAYNSIFQLSQAETITEEGKWIERIRYPRDYKNSSAGTPAIVEIMDENHVLDKPVEKVTLWQQGTSGPRVMNASFFNYQHVHNKLFKAKEVFNYTNVEGLPASEFTFSYLSAADGAHVLTKDLRYKLDLSFEYKNEYIFPLAKTDRQLNVSSTHYQLNTNKPVLFVQDAKVDEVLFSNFEHGSTSNQLSKTNIGDYGSKMGTSAIVPSGFSLNGTMKKPGEDRVVLTGWVKKYSGLAISLEVKFQNKDDQSELGTYTIDLPVSGSDWVFFEKKLSVEFYPQNLMVSITPINSVYLDELLLRPESAQATIVGYDKKGFRTYEADLRGGRINYFYDKLNRLSYTKDEKNVLSWLEYQDKGIIYPSPSISHSPFSPTDNDNVSFSASVSDCMKNSGNVFYWDLDGNGYVQGGETVSKKFEAGSYVVSMKMVHPTEGEFFYDSHFTVTQAPLTAKIYAKGLRWIDACTLQKQYYDESAPISTPSNVCTTNFYAAVSGGCPESGATYTYNWYVKTPTGSPVLKQSSSSATFSYSGVKPNGYEVYCEITSSCGKKDTSNIKTVTVENTNNCDTRTMCYE